MRDGYKIKEYFKSLYRRQTKHIMNKNKKRKHTSTHTHTHTSLENQGKSNGYFML